MLPAHKDMINFMEEKNPLEKIFIPENTGVFFYSINYLINCVSLLASLPGNSPLNFMVKCTFLNLSFLVQFLSTACLAFIVLICKFSTLRNLNLS